VFAWDVKVVRDGLGSDAVEGIVAAGYKGAVVARLILPLRHRSWLSFGPSRRPPAGRPRIFFVCCREVVVVRARGTEDEVACRWPEGKRRSRQRKG